MGGRVGLKGTDGWDTVERAVALGAKPWAQERAKRMLQKLLPLRNNIEILTYAGEMGEIAAKDYGFRTRVVGTPASAKTSPQDTKTAAIRMLRNGCSLIIFVGGDGTARDIYDAVALEIPSIGIPAGVKMYSAVFASSPEKGGELALQYLEGKIIDTMEREVMDIDEEKFRRGVFAVKLYGYLRVPYQRRYVVGGKSLTSIHERINQEGIATDILENMRDDIHYIIGPGTTTKMILKKMGCRYSLLGVDILHKGDVVGMDLNEKEILEIIRGKKAKIIVSPIGGQGYLLGRGNQQISPNVIREVDGKNGIIIVATQQKIINLRGKPFLVDTDDRDLDIKLSGWYRVITGYRERWMYRVEPG